MPNETGDLKFFRCLKNRLLTNEMIIGRYLADLDVKCCVESHLKVALIILVEQSQETLLKDRSSK